jgi:hypothetical protein
MKKSCFYTSLTLGFLLACPAHSQVLITNSYSYTGSSQQISVPLNTASIYFELYGASGGNASGNWTVYGGQGAFVSGNISLSLIGEVPIFLFVGGRLSTRPKSGPLADSTADSTASLGLVEVEAAQQI